MTTPQNNNNNNLKRIAELQTQLDSLYAEMPQTFFEQSQRDKSAFLITRELEKLQNPADYERNKAHWENHEIRL